MDWRTTRGPIFPTALRRSLHVPNKQANTLSVDSGRGVFLSAGSANLGDISVGDFAKIGAGAVDVPPGCTAIGVPARLTNCPGAGVFA
jgi:serine acetyltransferase